MIDVLLYGAAGKMGTAVAETVATCTDIRLVGGVEKAGHPAIGKPYGTGIIVSEEADPPQADVRLDFSLTGPAMEHCRRAAKDKSPFVLATTGFKPNQIEELLRLSSRFPLLYAPNLSLGVALLDLLAGTASEILLPEGYDPTLTDIHHRMKKDAPSGTAQRIAETVASYGKEPQIVSLRAGGVVGEHSLRFVGDNDELILTHRAFSRKLFADGVPRAVRFIIGKSPGWYTIQDLFRTD